MSRTDTAATPAPDAPDAPAAPEASGVPAAAPRRSGGLLRLLMVLVGALVFLFPFYYMLIGSLQTDRDPSLAGAFPDPSSLTLQNYRNIDAALDLGRSLVNSGVLTIGVILVTLVLGGLAGYALAQLHFRGKGLLFSAMLLVQVVPFQLLLIPLYVLIVRSYGLADSYLGMIAPFAINSTAVFIFRQYFLQIPRELFDAARIDGAGELRVLVSVALPMVRPALLTATLLTFIGPWNEFLWPFLITKQHSMQPLAVSLANYITTVAARSANPTGAILAGACVLAGPAVALFVVFQRHFTSTDIGSGVKG